MLRIEQKQLSFYSMLYEKIPDTHILKRIEKAVSFSFINELLADSYCKDNGRPAKEPEMMMKLLFLQYLNELVNKQESELRILEGKIVSKQENINKEIKTIKNESKQLTIEMQSIQDSIDSIDNEYIKYFIESRINNNDYF